MSWKRYAAERAVASACWLAVVVLTVFVIYRVVAPTPNRFLTPTAPPEQRARVLDYLASDLGDFLRQLAGGSLGESFTGSPDVNQQVAWAAPVTIGIALGAAAIALLIGVPAGLAWSGHRLRRLSLIGHLAVALLPVWFAFELSYYVGFRAAITPIAGYCDLFFPAPAAQCGGPVDWANHLLLPWATLAIPLAVLYARVVRGLASDVRRAVAARSSGRSGSGLGPQTTRGRGRDGPARDP